LAFGLAYIIAAIWALQVLRFKLPSFPLQDVMASLWRMAVAGLVMAEAVWLVARTVGANSGPGAVVRLVVSTIVGVAVYVAVLSVLQSPELDDLRSRIRPAPTATEAE
jgi:hypothetical protein